MTCLGGCAELAAALGLKGTPCCLSCHDEWDDGYGEPSEVEIGDGYYLVCCAIRTSAVEELARRDDAEQNARDKPKR